MPCSALTRSTLGQWIIAFAGLGLVIAPFGCETISMLRITPDGDGRFGWFVNEDQTSEVLLGARAPDEATLFAYGWFDEIGNIEKISAVVLRDPDGNESFIGLDERGWPVHLEIGDGSYAQINYSVQTDTHVEGEVRLYGAQDQPGEVLSFDVDLNQALDAIAAELEQRTGVKLAVLPEPNARTAAKTGQRNAQTVYYPLFLVPFVAMAYVVSYIATAIVNALVAVAAVAVQVTLLAVFAPIFLLAGVTNALLFRPISWVNLHHHFGLVPPLPIWALI